MSAANASFSEGIRAAFALLAQKQHAVENARALLGSLPSVIYAKRVAALKAAKTKASKAFARACFAEGFADAQAVADELTKAEEQALRLGILNEVERLQQEAAQPRASVIHTPTGPAVFLRGGGTLQCQSVVQAEEMAAAVNRFDAAKAAKAPKRCPLCGAELELHIDGTVSTPFFPKYPIRGAALPRREREAPFYACPSCEHCEEVSA